MKEDLPTADKVIEKIRQWPRRQLSQESQLSKEDALKKEEKKAEKIRDERAAQMHYNRK
jgi:hypothetical protein